MSLLKLISSLVLLTLSSCTDLVAVYKHDILLLRNVDQAAISEQPPMSWESHILRVPQPFSYPIGLTYDSEARRLFVAEKLHEDSKIFSLSLDADYNVRAMKSVMKTTNDTTMEGLTYDPRTEHLYWTDSRNHGVYKSWVPSDQKKNPTKPEPAHVFGNVIEPRGIAIDYCNELMYWSERDASGKIPSSIEVCDLQGLSHTIIQQNDGKEEKIFFQGLTYDITGGKLLWAETVGDDFTSLCRIVSDEFVQSAPQREVLVSLSNCYPFSLTIDENYIYWADWGQQGIMRASRRNKNDIVKLVHTPQIESKYGRHHGVYGLAILGGPTDDSIREMCKGKSSSQRDVIHQQQDSPAVNESAKVKDNKSPNVASQVKHKESLKEKELMQTGDSSDTNFNTAFGDSVLEDNTEDQVKESSEDHPEDQADEKNETGYPVDDQPKKESKTDNNEDLYTEKIETDDSEDKHNDLDRHSHHQAEETLHSSEANKTPVNGGRSCREGPLLIVVIVLAVFCTLFMLSTTFLTHKLWFQFGKRSYKVELPTTISERAAEVKPRQPKRFGPKNKPAVCGGFSNTQVAGNDGVRINIEDCCQMTLCDTPCYTTVKKEGRGYKCSIVSPSSCSDDKKGLLDDNDDLSNF